MSCTKNYEMLKTLQKKNITNNFPSQIYKFIKLNEDTFSYKTKMTM